jgi:hypothetical protein
LLAIEKLGISLPFVRQQERLLNFCDQKTRSTKPGSPTDSVPLETELEPENNNEKAARLMGLID